MNKTYPALAALALAFCATTASADKIKFDDWYGRSGDLGATPAQTCDRFNAAQDTYEAVCTGNDGCENVVQSAITAFRASCGSVAQIGWRAECPGGGPTDPARFGAGMPSAVKRFRTATPSWNPAT